MCNENICHHRFNFAYGISLVHRFLHTTLKFLGLAWKIPNVSHLKDFCVSSCYYTVIIQEIYVVQPCLPALELLCHRMTMSGLIPDPCLKSQ